MVGAYYNVGACDANKPNVTVIGLPFYAFLSKMIILFFRKTEPVVSVLENRHIQLMLSTDTQQFADCI